MRTELRESCETWTLRDFPRMESTRVDRMGELVRLIDVRGRQLLMSRDLGKRVWLCGETPVAYPSTREVWSWIGTAFMLGSVFGGFVVLLVAR